MTPSRDNSFLNYLAALGHVIMGQHEASKLVGHKGRRGSERERILGDCLLKLLPDRFGIGAGEIRSSNGRTSPEFDLIVYDRAFCAMLFNEKSVQIFPIESVYAVISVRSRLDNQHLREFSTSVQQLRDTRAYERSTPKALIDRSWFADKNEVWAHPTPAAFAFGFEGGSLKAFSDSLNEHYRSTASGGQFPPDPVLNCVCVMQRGIITQMVRPGDVNSIYPFPTHPEGSELHLTTVESGELAFPLFATCLIYALTETIVFPPGLEYYISAFRSLDKPVALSVVREPLPAGPRQATK